MSAELSSSRPAGCIRTENSAHLTNDQLISLLGIYSEREKFQIGQHQARANFYIGLVVSGLAVTILAFAQYQDKLSGRILLILPIFIAIVAELAIASLKRNYRRINDQILSRYTIEQLLLLHLPTAAIEGVPYYFPAEAIRPLNTGFRDELRSKSVSKLTFHRHYGGGGQQALLALIFRLAQLAGVILAALFVAPSLGF